MVCEVTACYRFAAFYRPNVSHEKRRRTIDRLLYTSSRPLPQNIIAGIHRQSLPMLQVVVDSKWNEFWKFNPFSLTETIIGTLI